MQRTGVLLIGILGHLSSVLLAGAFLLKEKRFDTTGMVTAREEFGHLDLIDPEMLTFGGWDIRQGKVSDVARESLVKAMLVDADTFNSVQPNLTDVEEYVFPGTAFNSGTAITALVDEGCCRSEISAYDLIDRIRNDIRTFRKQANVDRVVVVNLSSTEPPLDIEECHSSISGINDCIENDLRDKLRAGTLYAYAAILENCAFINFTPSNSILIPGIIRLAEQQGSPIMGNDGKTGETLVKSVLSSMFLVRNLQILSWEGFNILGNMDGMILDNPENRQSKISSKDTLLQPILGYSPHSKVHINYVPSLDDQKTAWDFIHFKGFLGTKMSLQFIWQGFDSILAAPLVLDLIRLADYAKRKQQSGTMPHLASFFKTPIGVTEHRLHEQFEMLLKYAGDERASVRR